MLLIISVLSERKIFGAVLIGIFSVTMIGFFMGIVEYNGILIPRLA